MKAICEGLGVGGPSLNSPTSPETFLHLLSLCIVNTGGSPPSVGGSGVGGQRHFGAGMAPGWCPCRRPTRPSWGGDGLPHGADQKQIGAAACLLWPPRDQLLSIWTQRVQSLLCLQSHVSKSMWSVGMLRSSGNTRTAFVQSWLRKCVPSEQLQLSLMVKKNTPTYVRKVTWKYLMSTER